MKIAYVGVSTQEQNLDRQLELLKPYGIERFFQEKQSGKDMGREKLNELLEFVREGDEVYVESWSRLSRTVSDLLKLFDRKKVRLYSVKEQYDTSSPTGKLMVNIIAALNQFERENLLERQREGIACAKQKGVYRGRKPKEFDVNILSEVLADIEQKEMTVTEAAKVLGVTRATIYNIMKRAKRRQKTMMIKKFNDNHASNLQKTTATARGAQIQIDTKSDKNTTDIVISSIGQVLRSTNYYKIKFKNGSSLILYFNGRYEKYYCNGKLASKDGVGSKNNAGFVENGHIFLSINGNMISFERLVAICDDFTANRVATDYDNLSANVMDGSGSVYTAIELGIPMNFHPDNIEWTTPQENGSHGYLIRELYEITGHVYRFSAYDSYLLALYKKNLFEVLRDHCKRYLFEVK